MATIRIEDLPALEQLGIEEVEQILGAGRGVRRARLGLETLEGREVPAAAFDAATGVLDIQGTPGNDNVWVANQLDLTTFRTVVRVQEGAAATVFNVYPSAVKTIRFSGGDGDDRFQITTAGFENAILDVDGGRGNDVLSGASRVSAVLRGGEGNDVLQSASSVFGDYLHPMLPTGPTQLIGGAGNDNLSVGNGVASWTALDGGAGLNVIQGVLTIEGGGGVDNVVVGRDTARFTMPNGYSNACLVVTHNGTTYAGIPGEPTIEFNGNAGNDTFVNDTDRPCVARGGSGDDILYGGAGNDVLYGDGGNDGVRGGAGDDVLYGGTDKGVGDLIPGKSGASASDWYKNSFAGGLGNDKIYGADGFDGMLGGGTAADLAQDAAKMGLTSTPPDGNDVMYGYGGNDVMGGGDGDDSLYGGDGWDILVGEGGNDTLYANDVGIYRDPANDPYYATAWRPSAPHNGISRPAGGVPVWTPVERLFGDYEIGASGNYVPDASGINYNPGNDNMYGTEGIDFVAVAGSYGVDTFDGHGGADVFI